MGPPKYVVALVSLAASVSVLLGCSAQAPAPTPPAPTTTADPYSGAVTKEGQPDQLTGRPLNLNATEIDQAPRPPVLKLGTGQLSGRPTSPPLAVTDTGDITLNFVNADLGTVAKTVFQDLLKANYSLDSSVAQTTLTLQTTTPIHRADLLPLVEQSLRISNVALVYQGGTYRLMPTAQAAQQANTLPAHGVGFGVDIVPLGHVSAASVQRLLAPMITTGTYLAAAPDHNVLLIGGSGSDRSALIENVRMLDVDWLAGMSFEMFTLQSADAAAVSEELRNIMGTKEGPLDGVVRILPIPRINAVLVASVQAKYLNDARQWVAQLDRTEDPRSPRLYVYYVQNGRAADLAKVLNLTFGNASTQETTTSSSQAATSLNTSSGSQTDQAASNSLGGGAPAGSATLPSPTRGFGPGASTTVAAPATAESSLLGDLTATGGAGTTASSPRITADIATNALLILADRSQYEMVKAALMKLDIAPLQVMLEAAVAEVTLTNDLQYGLQYYFGSGKNHNNNIEFNPSGPNSFGTPTITPTFPNSNTNITGFPGFAYMFSSGADIRAVLDALQDVTRVRVISAPKLLVLSNQTAQLLVGDQVPILTSQATSTITENAPTINQVQYAATGVILKLTPRVNEGGLVTMDVSQEVSSIASQTSGGIDSPTISDRKISSTIAIQDGETVALGGMIQDTNTAENTGIPWLQDIPGLGALFRDTQRSGQRIELLVLITPHTLQSTDQLRAVTQALRKEVPAAQAVFANP